MFGKTSYGRIVGAISGFSVVGIGKVYKKLYENRTDTAWIPKERRRENELNEYIDILKYIKNTRLYEEYAHKAMTKEHFDIKKYIETERQNGELRKQKIEELQNIKRDIKINGINYRTKKEIKALKIKNTGHNYEDSLPAINAEINSLLQYRTVDVLPPNATAALNYYNRAKQTMYSYEQGDSIADVLKALPKRERQYMKYFMKAPDSEKMKILKIAPRFVRRPLESIWGLDVESKPNLVQYFKTHQLPGPKWKGWNENTDLDVVKVKMVKHEGLDFAEFNIWRDDIKIANSYGDMELPKIRNFRENSQDIRSKLINILHGVGVKDVKITMHYSSQDANVNLYLTHDQSNQIQNQINNMSIL